MPSRPRLLLVDDSEAFRRSMTRALERDYEVVTACGTGEARGLLTPAPNAVLLDLRLDEGDPSNAESLGLLADLREELPSVPVIVITAYSDVDHAVECMRRGAVDFIEKRGGLGALKARIDKALEQAQVVARLRQLEEELAIVEPRELVGQSSAITDVKEMIAAVARDSTVTVLITGETGTGKELVARAIHASGPRAQRPFVAVAVSTLPETTVEAELFGYEPGAFTDARRRKAGYIERANGGVLFLDEIGELPPVTQVKLLRFLEERTISRLGGAKDLPMDVQVVAATHAQLTGAIRAGTFREDLYYRLKVCEIRLPSLRERREDIPLLVEHFLAKLGARSRGVGVVSREAEAALLRYAWPGNVRELRNTLEAALIRAGLRHHRRVESGDLPVEILGKAEPPEVGSPTSTQAQSAPISAANSPSLEEVLAETELAAVERALAVSGGRKTEAWKLLGLNDRYVFTRRVKRILHRHPMLAARHPAVCAAFRTHPIGADNPGRE